MSAAAARIRGEPDQQLAEITALQQPDKGLWCAIETVDDVLPVLQRAAPDQRGSHRPVFAPALPLVADDESLDFNALAHGCHEIGTRARLDVVIFGDHSTHDHAGEIVEPRKHRLLDGPADILEINVDPVRASAVEGGAQIRDAMVDRCIETELSLD